MIALAKITTFFIFMLLVTYGVIFYSPAIKNGFSLQNPTIIPNITSIPASTSVSQKPTSTPIVLQPTIAKLTPVVDTRCIITVDGGRYDVTEYRNIHSGGNIFQCGTDMSTIFHNRHSNKFLQQMSQYKII